MVFAWHDTIVCSDRCRCRLWNVIELQTRTFCEMRLIEVEKNYEYYYRILLLIGALETIRAKLHLGLSRARDAGWTNTTCVYIPAVRHFVLASACQLPLHIQFIVNLCACEWCIQCVKCSRTCNRPTNEAFTRHSTDSIEYANHFEVYALCVCEPGFAHKSHIISHEHFAHRTNTKKLKPMRSNETHTHHEAATICDERTVVLIENYTIFRCCCCWRVVMCAFAWLICWERSSTEIYSNWKLNEINWRTQKVSLFRLSWQTLPSPSLTSSPHPKPVASSHMNTIFVWLHRRWHYSLFCFLLVRAHAVRVVVVLHLCSQFILHPLRMGRIVWIGAKLIIGLGEAGRCDVAWMRPDFTWVTIVEWRTNLTVH